MQHLILQIAPICLLVLCVSSCFGPNATIRGETLTRDGCIYCIVITGTVKDLDKCNEQNKDNKLKCNAVFDQLRNP